MTPAEKARLIEIYETMVKNLEAELAAAKLPWLKTELEGLVAGAHENLANAKAW